MDVITKTCNTCSKTKSLDEFYKGTGKLGVKASCKRCHNDAIIAKQRTPEGKIMQVVKRLKHRYGITLDQYDWLLEQQDGKCYLCGEDERVPHHKSGELMRLAVDHDHRCCPGDKKACGKCVRGLLCYNCNRFMGRVDRSPLLAERFKDYIDRRPLEPVRKCWNSGKGGHLCNKKCENEPPYGTTLDDLVEESRKKQFEQYAEWSDKQIRSLYEGELRAIRPSINNHIAMRMFDLPEEDSNGR